MMMTTGIFLQQLLRGFAGPRTRKDLNRTIRSLLFISPDRQDHIEAADLRNRCRRSGLQVGTIDVLLCSAVHQAWFDHAEHRQGLRPDRR
jgi:predicted nucleic acid-binding protein